MSKNIFIVSELFYPNKTSTAYIMTEIAKFLSIEHQVNVICSDIIYDKNFDHDALDEDVATLNLIRKKSSSGSKNSVLGRLKNALQTSGSFGWLIISKIKKSDVVFAVTNPFLLVLVLALIRTVKKFKFILLVHDVFPENAVPAGLLNKNSLSFKISKKLYDWAYSKADRLIVLGRDMAELVSSKVGSDAKISIVENWFDTDLENEITIDRNLYVGKDLSDKIIIGFAGNIGRVQNLSQFLKIFKKVNNSKLHFLIVGDGALSNEIEQIIKDNSLLNVSYLGAKPRTEQALFLNCCDIGLVTLSQGMHGLGVPSKTYNLLALGKPILFIGDTGSEVDLLVTKEGVGWSFNWDEQDRLKLFLANFQIVDLKMKDLSKKIAQEKFSAEILLSKINALIND